MGCILVLAKSDACEPWERFKDDWNARFEPLVNRVDMGGKDHLELSATGQIFHETFRSRFQKTKAASLPRAAEEGEKESPKLRPHNYKGNEDRIYHFLQKLTDAKSYIRYCHSTYWNPGLSESTRFRISGGKVEGIYSDKGWCLKFEVFTTETNTGPRSNRCGRSQ